MSFTFTYSPALETGDYSFVMVKNNRTIDGYSKINRNLRSVTNHIIVITILSALIMLAGSNQEI